MRDVIWERVDADTFERLVGVILSRLNPDVRRLDGRGGDWGRDAEFLTPDGPVLFEFKSFAGRLARPQKRQVERSLKRASERNPIRWTLIVPIQPTHQELEWFQRVQAETSFTLEWWGLDWLNEQMMRFPDIRRYFLDDGAHALADLLAQVKEEQAGLAGGVPDAVDRMRNILDQANEIDPYYEFEITLAPDGHEVAIKPKYAGAEIDRPIKINCDFVFPDTTEGREAERNMRNVFHYGLAGELGGDFLKNVRIDAPAGLGGEFADGAGRLMMKSTGHEDWNHAGTLRAMRGKKRLAAIPVNLSDLTTGSRGASFRVTDRTESFTIQLVADVVAASAQLHVSFSVSGTATPAELLPTLAFLKSMGSANHLELKSGMPKSDVWALPPGGIDLSAAHRLEELCHALSQLQEHSDDYFPLPATIAGDDADVTLWAAQLLRGEVADGYWDTITLSIRDEGLEHVINHARSGEPFAFLMDTDDVRVEVFDHTFPIGKVRHHTPSMVVHEPESVLEAAKSVTPGEHLRVKLRRHGRVTSRLLGDAAA